MGRPRLTESERSAIALGALLVAAVLMAGGWLFWQAGTGQAMVITAVVVGVGSVAIRPSWKTIVGLLLAMLAGCMPLILILLFTVT